MTLATQGYVLPLVEVRLRPCQEFVSGLAQARPALRVHPLEERFLSKAASIQISTIQSLFLVTSGCAVCYKNKNQKCRNSMDQTRYQS